MPRPILAICSDDAFTEELNATGRLTSQRASESRSSQALDALLFRRRCLFEPQDPRSAIGMIASPAVAFLTDDTLSLEGGQLCIRNRRELPSILKPDACVHSNGRIESEIGSNPVQDYPNDLVY